MTPPVVGLGTLRRLSELGCGRPVLSVYLELGPRAPAGCAAQMQTCLAELAPEASDADVRRVCEMLRSMPEPAHGTRSLSFFSTAEGSAFAAVPLPAAVQSMVVVDTVPWLEPLAGIFTSGDWGIALVGGQGARLLRGAPNALVEFAALHDEPHRDPLPGERCQAGAPRLIEERLGEYAAHVARLLLRAHRRRAFERLAVAAPRQLWPAIEGALHSDLRERLAGLVELDLRDAPAHEVSRALAAVVHEAERGGALHCGTSTATGPRGATRPAVHSTSTRCLPFVACATHADSRNEETATAGVPTASSAVRERAAA